MSNRPKEMSTEFFYLDENGVPQDADLHADLLENQDPEFKRQQMEETRAYIRKQYGSSEEELDRWYPLPPQADPAP